MRTEAEVYTYTKTRRMEIEKGTRAANCLIGFRWDKKKARKEATKRARNIAVEMYERQWGKVPWDCAEVMIFNATCQVVVEIRVAP